MDKRPEFFYKYRSLNHLELGGDETLDALFNSYAIFSSRKNFNDPFDCKILFPDPNIAEFKKIINNINIHNPLSREYPRLVQKELINKNQKRTKKGDEMVMRMVRAIENRIDQYMFYSLSAQNSNILLWSHYGGAHTGFCIEFKSNCIEAQKVEYQQSVPSIKIADLLLTDCEDDNNLAGERIKKALLIKLLDWKYEEEYRLHFNEKTPYENMPNLKKKIFYKNHFIESIIFGSRMPEKTRMYIINNMPSDTRYKIAIELDSSILIKDYVRTK